jgi:site-specific DNA-methyltransferase (adenine-specific)
MDCMEFMKDKPDNFYDLAIVDPPFGIGSWWKKSKNTKHYSDKHWNEAPPSKEYFTELFRVSKNQIIWGGNYFTEHLPPTNAWIIWDKLMAKNQNLSDCEMAWTSLKMSVKKITVLWSGACRNEKNFVRIHPSQRPVKLHTQTLQKFAKPGYKILDTHLGSGSIAIACMEMGFDLDATEIDNDFFLATAGRVEDYKKQLKLVL